MATNSDDRSSDSDKQFREEPQKHECKCKDQEYFASLEETRQAIEDFELSTSSKFSFWLTKGSFNNQVSGKYRLYREIGPQNKTMFLRS